MNMLKHSAQIISVFALSLLFTSCELINGGGGSINDEQELAKLTGEWVRVLSNNPSNDGLVLEVVGDKGTITENPRGGFNIGDVKWTNILALEENLFDYEELGSDGNYYGATMELDGDTVFLSIESSGAGNIQRWVKRSGYTDPGPSTLPTTLDCNQLTNATTLVNGPGAVDYIVPAGCVLDVTEPLIIEAGTVIEFEENAGMGVYDNGTIKAIGTATEPIIMRGTTAARGYWRGIHVETNSLENQFDYVEVSHAGSNYVYCCNIVSTLHLKGGKMSIQNSTFSEGDGAGIYANGAADIREFNNNTITTHTEYPLHLDIERLGDLDGTGSDLTGNDNDFVYVFKSNVDVAISVPEQTVPYLFDGAVMDIKEVMTLEAGVEIAMEENGGIGVFDNGALTINGTAANPVIIRGKEANKGYWRGIHIETNSSSNNISNAQISDAGSDYVYCCNTVASLFLKDGKASISNTTISNGGSYGIATKADFAFGTFTNNTVTTHSLEPLYITATQAGQLDGLGTDYTGNTRDNILLYRNQVAEVTVLSETNVPYLVDNNTVLDVTEPLTLEAGVDLVFAENAGLGIYDNGTLKATGTASKPVKFRGKEPIVGYWRGIHTETNSSNNNLDYVQISHAASNYVYCCNDKAGLFVRSGTMTLTNSQINDNDGCGVFVRSAATLTESNNTFSNNTDGNICN